MRVKALRGVCVGVDRHLRAGDSADLDAATVTFLVSIKAVEVVKDEPEQAAVPAKVNTEQSGQDKKGNPEADADKKSKKEK